MSYLDRSEKAIFTNMCMVENDIGQVLVQNRKKSDWPGLTFPGGHVENNESFHDSVIREVWEETGLLIKKPLLCGIKQFQTSLNERYIVLLYKTNIFSGGLIDSDEGEVFWIEKDELLSTQTAPDFLDMYKVFTCSDVSELYYHPSDSNLVKEIL